MKKKLEAGTLPNGRLMPKKPLHRCSDFLSDPKFSKRLRKRLREGLRAGLDGLIAACSSDIFVIPAWGTTATVPGPPLQIPAYEDRTNDPSEAEKRQASLIPLRPASTF